MSVKIDYAEWCARNGVKPELRVKFLDGAWLLAKHFDPENVRILQAALYTAPRVYEDVVVVTAGGDGKHGEESRHFHGDGWDLRILGFRAGGMWAGDKAPPEGDVAAHRIFAERQKMVAKAWCERIRYELRKGFDVVLESNHIHMERNKL
jgi:hypothetical protein